jgi:hypothetical protein
VVRKLPGAVAALQKLVNGGRSIDHVGNPSVPARLDVRGIKFVLLIVDPSCTEGKLFLHILEVLVAEAVDSDQGSGLGITDILETSEKKVNVSFRAFLPTPSLISAVGNVRASGGQHPSGQLGASCAASS